MEVVTRLVLRPSLTRLAAVSKATMISTVDCLSDASTAPSRAPTSEDILWKLVSIDTTVTVQVHHEGDVSWVWG